ncbi:MAG: hypothetical protein AAGD96_32465, partial [Chloroflexota bacterium]
SINQLVAKMLVPPNLKNTRIKIQARRGGGAQRNRVTFRQIIGFLSIDRHMTAKYTSLVFVQQISNLFPLNVLRGALKQHPRHTHHALHG